jgi:hypothetical protein
MTCVCESILRRAEQRGGGKKKEPGKLSHARLHIGDSAASHLWPRCGRLTLLCIDEKRGALAETETAAQPDNSRLI